MNSVIRSVVHPTDFSDLSGKAFAHALRIALAARSTLHLLHVAELDGGRDDGAFPHVRRLLAQWGLIEEDASASTLDDRLGIRVVNTILDRQDIVRGIIGLPLSDLAPRSRGSGRSARHDMRCSGRQQYDIARKLFDWRLTFDAHPTHARGHGVQRRLRGPRKADAPRSSSAQVRHHGATHA